MLFRVICGFLMIGALATLTSCTTGEVNTENQTDLTALYGEFTNAFKPIDVPFAVPAPNEGAAHNELTQDMIAVLFGERQFDPAFGSAKDVPDLEENIQTSKYYAVGMLESDSFNAFIIHKVNSGDYYYLATFAPDGHFIDGMCIAFSEGAVDVVTERIASLNEDRSLHIIQRELLNGEQRGDAATAFYEISTDGIIAEIGDSPSVQ